MAELRNLVRIALAGALGVNAAGCEPPEPPGEQVGIFDVVSTLQENTCGPTAVIAGDTEFAIELRRDQESAYWQVLDGQPLVGRYQGEDTFEVTLQTLVQLYAPGELDDQNLDDPLDFARLGPQPGGMSQQPGCRLSQDEVLTAQLSGDWLAELDGGAGGDATTPDMDAGGDDRDGGAGDAGVEPPDLTAVHVQTLAPTADSDCSRALAVKGGPFVALPCTVRYSLTATRREP